MQALGGTLVVDFTRYLPGAFAARELRRLGARVVRVEQPGGDPMRQTAPEWHDALNAGTESVVCELPARRATSRGRCSNGPTWSSSRSGPGSPRAWASARPTRLRAPCTARSPGFGARRRARAARRATTSTTSGFAGLLEDTAPALPPVQAADLAAGALGAVTQVLAALLARERTGAGRAHRRLDDARRAAAARGLTGAHAGVRVLLDLRVRRRPPPDGRCARAEVLRPLCASSSDRPELAERQYDADQPAVKGALAERLLDAAAGALAAHCSRTKTSASARSRRERKRPPSSARRESGHAPATRRAHARLAAGARPVIAAYAAAAVIRPEPRDARMLVHDGGAIVSRHSRRRTRKRLIANAQDAAYSPDGTLVAFARSGDLWLANADGSGQRRLAATPNVDGVGSVVAARRQRDRLHGECRRPEADPRRSSCRRGRRRASRRATPRSTAPPSRASGKLAFVSTRSGTPAIYVAQSNGTRRHRLRHDAAGDAVQRHPRPRLVARRDEARLRRRPRRRHDRDRRRRRHDADAPAAGARPVWSPARDAHRVRERRATSCRSRSTAPTSARSASARRSTGGRPGRHAEVPEPRAAAAERARDRAHRRRPLAARLHVDGRQPRPRHPLDPRHSRRAGSRVMIVHQLVQLAGGSTRVDRGVGRAEVRERAAASSLALPRLRPLRAAQRLRLQAHRARLQERLLHRRPLGHRDRRAARTAAVPRRLRAVPTRRRARSRRARRSATPTAIPAFFHGQQLDITKVPAGRYWLVHRANEDFHLRETSYGDNAASILIRLTWHGGARA